MNNEEMTFVEKVKKGLCSIDDIDDYIDKWHDEYQGNLKLYEYLGMTEDEYEKWLTNPDSLKTMYHKEPEPVYVAKQLIRIAKQILKDK